MEKRYGCERQWRAFIKEFNCPWKGDFGNRNLRAVGGG